MTCTGTNPPTPAPYETSQPIAARRFDALTRLMATKRSRRHLLAGLAGGITLALIGNRGREHEAAACDAGAGPCTSDGECCSGICDPHLYRCLAQPTVCMGSPDQQAVAGPQVGCTCGVPSGPPRSVIVSGVPERQGRLHQPVHETSQGPTTGGARPDPSCQTLPGEPGLPIVAGPTAPKPESGDRGAQTPPESHQNVAWNF